VNPAIVDINTNLGYESASAAGTGIVLTSNGTVLTNNHVINGATQITATDIGNGKTYKATVVGYDRSSDVAVIQLQNASGLATANLGDSRTASVGQSVIGIGNAGGAGGTPSTAAGTITALNQSITASDQSSSTSEQLSGLIQTNAPIQPGDSGGPLVTMRGVVIGMNTAASSNFQFSGSASGTTQGFSIPINSALQIAHQITSGKASDSIHLGATGFMGVQVQAANSSTDPFNGQGGSQSSTTGVSVVGAVSGSPADKAGIAQGDTIVSVNGKAVATPEQLSAIVSRFRPGNTITLVWQDASGTTHTSAITLAVGPAA
jgi:S1-C subfamily serine protease